MQDLSQPNPKRILILLLRKTWLILLVTALSGSVAYGITSRLVIPRYTANIKMYVNNSTEINKNISSSDLTASQSLVDTCIAIITSDVVLDEVAKQTGIPGGADSVRGMISAGSINKTEVFMVSITNPIPSMAEKIANSVATVASNKISEIVSGSSVKIVDYAKTPTRASSPNYYMNVAVGALVGLLLIIGILLLKELLDTRIKTGTDLEKMTDIPILGAVSQFSQATKDSGSYGPSCSESREKKARVS